MATLKITHGYSKDHWPDLRQFLVDVICSNDGDVPLFLRVGDGNESDSAVFGNLIAEFQQQWTQPQLRQALAAQGETIPNQLGKPTAKPPLRWGFMCFQSVHLLQWK